MWMMGAALLFYQYNNCRYHMPKLFQVWPGKNRFFCGCCITGSLKDCGANLCWYICASIVLILYCIFILKNVWDNITPALPIVFFLSVITTTIFLNLTSCTDPGIIPRRPILQFLKNERAEQFLLTNQQTKRLCTTCNIYRPPRASHCSSCQNCVEVFDHHCPFVNNCVGKRNYRFFISFLAGVMCSIVTAIINLVVFFMNQGGSQVNSTVAIIICSVILGIIALPMLIFLIFHIYLSIKGKTTRQLLKHLNRENQGPGNQWCNVDPPIFDPYLVISQQQKAQIKSAIGFRE